MSMFSVKLPKVPDSILEHFGKRYGIGNDDHISNILGTFTILYINSRAGSRSEIRRNTTCRACKASQTDVRICKIFLITSDGFRV